MRNVFKLLPAALGLFALVSCNSDDFGSASQVDLTGKAVLEVTDGDEGLTRSFKTATLGTQWESGDVLRVYDDKLQAYYNFDYATADGSAKFVYNGDKDLTNFAATYVLYGVEASDLSYAGWKDEKHIALLKVKSEYDYSESDASTVGYKSILPMLGKVNEVDKSGAQPWLKATTYTLTARAKVTFKNGAGAGVKRVRARALKFETGKDIEDVAFAKEATTVTADGSSVKDNFDGIATATGAPNLNGWFEAVLDKDITAATTEGGLQACDETVVNNTAATNTIEVSVADGAMEDYTNCIFFPIAPGDYDLIVFEYSTLDADANTDGAVNWQYIGYAAGTINRTMKFGDFSDAATAICPTDLTIETEIEITRQNIKNTEALTQLMADQNNDNAAVKIIIDNETGSEPLTSLSGAESQWTIYIPQLKNDMTIDVQGTTDLTAHQLVIKDVAGADNSAYNVNFNFKEFEASSKAIQIETTAKVLLTGDYTKLPAVSDDEVAIDVVKTAGLTLGTTTESFKANGKEIDVAAGDVTFVRGTINLLLNTAENTINVNGTSASTIARLNAGTKSTVNINSGTVTNTAASGTSTVNVAGGVITKVDATQQASVNVTGGEVATGGAISTTQGALTIGPAATGATITIANNAALETTTGVVTIDAKNVTVPALTIKGTTSLNLNNGTITKLTYSGSADEDAPITVTVTSKGKSAIKDVEVETSTYAEATYTSSFDATLTGNEKADAVSDAFGTAFSTGDLNGYIPVYTAAQLAGAAALSDKAALVTEITDLKGWTSPDLSYEFNGNGKEITTDAPLFGTLKANVTNIKKLTVNINKTATTIGALAKQTSNVAVTVTKVAIEGSIAAQNKVGGVIGVTTTGTVTFGDGTTSGANAYKNAVTVNVTFTNNTSYPGTMAYNPNAGTFGKFIGQAGTGAVDIKADCSVGSAAFSKDDLHFGYNRILDDEGVIIYTFQGSDANLIGYSPTAVSLTYGGKTLTNVWTTDDSESGKAAYNATTKKVTGNVYYIGKAWNETGAFKGLDAATKTAIKNALGLADGAVAADADWSGVTVYAHNVYVAAAAE